AAAIPRLAHTTPIMPNHHTMFCSRFISIPPLSRYCSPWWRGHLGRVTDHAGKMPASPPGFIQSRTALLVCPLRFFHILGCATTSPLRKVQHVLVRVHPSAVQLAVQTGSFFHLTVKGSLYYRDANRRFIIDERVQFAFNLVIPCDFLDR